MSIVDNAAATVRLSKNGHPQSHSSLKKKQPFSRALVAVLYLLWFEHTHTQSLMLIITCELDHDRQIRMYILE